MLDIPAINKFIQERLRIDKLDVVTAVEANQWLSQAGLLSDDRHRPGKPLRGLLRKALIAGAWQDPPKRHGRWFIGKVSVGNEGGVGRRLSVKRQTITGGRLPPSLRAGVDIVIVGERPGRKSLEVGCYYADTRNSFWRDLYESGLTSRLFDPCQYDLLLDLSPSIGLDDLYDDAEGLRKRLSECKPRLIVFNSKRTESRAKSSTGGRRILNEIQSTALFDSSGQARAWRSERLRQLQEVRQRFQGAPR